MCNLTSITGVKGIYGSILIFFLVAFSFYPDYVLGAPVADAGDDQEVVSDQTVNLDATGSSGNIIAYEWIQTSGPTIDLGEQSYIAQPSFIAPTVAGETELVFFLSVIDNLEETDSDTVSIWVYPGQGGVGPNADAGDNQICNQGDTVILDGTESTGTGITYEWIQTSGADVSLDQDTSMQPSFVAPDSGGEMSTLIFNLTVTDSGQNSDTDTVVVQVFPENVTIDITPDGNPLGIRVDNGSILTRYIITSSEVYTSTITVTGQAPLDLPHGLTDIGISSQDVITETGVYTSTATFFLPTAAPPDHGWAKLSLRTNEWIDFSEHIVFNPNRTVVTVTLTDGGPGDDNPALGIIDDPSGLALIPAADDDDNAGDGGDGGSCFIMMCLPHRF
jgi:K319L-like, PKD domain